MWISPSSLCGILEIDLILLQRYIPGDFQRDFSRYFVIFREISRQKMPKPLEISRFFSFFHDVNFLQKFPI